MYVFNIHGNPSCEECGRWVHKGPGGVIKHSSRCDLKDDRTVHPGGGQLAQPEAPEEPKGDKVMEKLETAAKLAQNGQAGTADPDDLLHAVQAGLVSWSDAMNSDT